MTPLLTSLIRASALGAALVVAAPAIPVETSAIPFAASAIPFAASAMAQTATEDAVIEPIETVIVPADELRADVDRTIGVVVETEGGGMPQLDAGSWPAQLFWLSLIFAGFYFFLSRVALPRVATVLEERRDRIANDLDQAALLQKRGDEALAGYEQSLAEARNKASEHARRMRDDVTAEGDARSKELEAELAAEAVKAEARIKASRDGAMANVQTIAAEAAEAIVGRITGEAPDRGRVDAAVVAALN